jgi:hypothetical protein
MIALASVRQTNHIVCVEGFALQSYGLQQGSRQRQGWRPLLCNLPYTNLKIRQGQ